MLRAGASGYGDRCSLRRHDGLNFLSSARDGGIYDEGHQDRRLQRLRGGPNLRAGKVSIF